ncbi:MAG: arsenite methyltransferase, partial [Omnitrophica WOR_2 bacterium]
GDSSCNSELYNPDLLTKIPEDITNFSLGCGDPISLAGIQAGQTVLDLGSGGGLDCFLAARLVGTTGRVIGVDMTPEMLAKARSAADRIGLTNVEFRQGYLEDLPVEDHSVDVVISNCVINLSPDKPSVFREVFRVLKPGGKISVSDIVTSGAMPEAMKANMDAWSACVSGAIPSEEYVDGLRQTGFVDIQIQAKTMDNELALTPVGMPYSALITAIKPD